MGASWAGAVLVRSWASSGEVVSANAVAMSVWWRFMVGLSCTVCKETWRDGLEAHPTERGEGLVVCVPCGEELVAAAVALGVVGEVVKVVVDVVMVVTVTGMISSIVVMI